MAQRSNLQYSAINFSGSGNNTIVAGSTVPTGSGMRPSFLNIWGLALVLGGASNLTFQDGTNPLSGALAMLANGSIFCPPTDAAPWFKTSPGNAFVINSSSAVQVSGWIIWSV